MTTNECSICYENIQELYSKWTCNHNFHKNCIAQWHNGCPLCRCIVIKRLNNGSDSDTESESDPDYPKENILDIDQISNLFDVPIASRQLYLMRWKKRACIENNHQMLIKEPYCTMVICVNCNLIKTFNRLH